jgi:hypothetical protein
MDPLADSDPSTFVYRDIGAADEPDEPETAEPGLPYGPDDPAYGPPTPDWYARQEEEEEATQQAAAEELPYVRGPFEPLPHSAEASQAAAGDWAASALYEPAPGEDDGFGGPGDGALEQIKDLYQTAEAIGAENLDKHFHQLLERQRQLISDYFKDFGLRAPAGASGSSRGDGPNGSDDRSRVSDNEHSAGGLEGVNGLGSGQVTFGSDRRSPR